MKAPTQRQSYSYECQAFNNVSQINVLLSADGMKNQLVRNTMTDYKFSDLTVTDTWDNWD